MQSTQTVTTHTIQTTTEIEPSTGSLLDDHKVNNLALAFMRADMPDGITTHDKLLVGYLIQRRAFDHPVNDSQLTLSKILKCSLNTVARSLERLASPGIGWITKAKRQGHSDGIALVHENLPLAENDRLQITEAAKKLAGKYQQALIKLGRKKYPKGWLSLQVVSAQRILNDCDGEFRLACSILSHALRSPAHRLSSRKSLYHICVRWKHIGATYAAEQLAQAAAAAQEVSA
jgi:hypothetical protein